MLARGSEFRRYTVKGSPCQQQAEAAGSGQGRYIPPGASRGRTERGCGNFFQHEIYKNYVCSVEAGMGMEAKSCA